ncbi:MAG: prolyl oligopeptidase family serine peptidase [Bacteroidetes bacterium]|nr:prolyl oligopeptidase family serine peptidase [Bacteroidota bacterium]
MKTKITLFATVCLLLSSLAFGQIDMKYQTPTADLAAIVDVPSTPGTSLNIEAGVILILERPGYPGIEDLAQEMLRLAGTRIDPATNGPSRPSYSTGIKVVNLSTGEEKTVNNLPLIPKIGSISWSPDKSGFVFTQTKSDEIELWYVDLESLSARKLVDNINGLMGSTFTWMPDGKSLICKVIPPARGSRPMSSSLSEGPVIRENLGKEAAVRTYQDLLENKQDEELFKYLVTSELVSVKLDGSRKKIGKADLYKGISPSPDGKFLMVNRMKEPFSYLVPYYSFPYDVEIWTPDGKKEITIHEFQIIESIPKGFGATQPGPRSFNWRSDAGASLVWVEALDEGDPKVEVPYRDVVYILDAPFNGKAVELLKTKLRFGGITWGNDELAVVTQSWRSTRQSVTSFFNPAVPEQGLKTIWDRSSEDRYSDPGRFVTAENSFGRNSLLLAGRSKKLFLTGSGASPEGNRPFLDEFDIASYETKRLWRSEAPYYETVVKLYDVKKLMMITNRQSKTEPSNYFIRDLKKNKIKQITSFENPYPFMEGVKKEMITYMRDDGVQLSATLYLPAGWKPEHGPLPTLLWAYPREFKSKQAASQISGSPYRFTRVSPTSSIPFVTQGYAILDGAAFPIIGEGDEQPNDHFVEQLVANAKAAIDKAAEMGVTDPKRVGVGGHSYGAFMTANLLAHCDLFAAGIARSGAYNRTLTPFGFQAEPRTFWEAPEVYFTMSPFMHANKVNEALLMIHGIADNNSGTFPIQSERFYNALKGHGATTRLVMLPLESHGYRARESLKHMLWEMDTWLDTYVKNKK